MDERETIQEVRERLVRIETLLETKLFNLEDRVKELEAKKKEHELTETELKTELKEAQIKIKNLETSIKESSDNYRWLWRTVIGGFISAAIAIYLKK